MNNENEQRKNQRFELKLPFEIIRAGTSTKMVGETKNVSSIAVVKSSLYTFGFATRGFGQVKNSGGVACR